MNVLWPMGGSGSGGGGFDQHCHKRGGSCACGGDQCGRDARRATPPSPSAAEPIAKLAVKSLETRMDTGSAGSAKVGAEDERAAFEAAYYSHWLNDNVAFEDDWSCIFQRSDYDAERYMQIETEEAWIGWRLARAALAANAADSEAKERDAARYRWLRNQARETSDIAPIVVMMDCGGRIVSDVANDGLRSHEELDDAIDAAMKATQKEE